MEEKKELEKELQKEPQKEPQEMKKRGRSRRRPEGAEGAKRKRPLLIAGCVVLAGLILAAGAAGYYFYQAARYETAFFPNTNINGIDASGKTVEDVKAAIEEGLSSYELKIIARNGVEETVTKDEIGLHSEFDGTMEQILVAQNPMEWVKYLQNGTDHQIETMIVFDEEKLDAAIEGLSIMDRDSMVEPENAYVSDYQSGTKSYEVVPASKGTELIAENVKNAVKNAIMNLSTEVDLDAEGCYTKAAIDENDESLNALADQLNVYAGAVVNFTFGDQTEVLDGDRIHEWLTVDGQTVTLDESQAAEYVKELAAKYDTAYKSKTLKTTHGETVTISKGNYGWRINKNAETAAVLEAVKAGSQVTREPEYLQTAASRGENDYGDTYVEVNLTAQHLYFYKDGKLLVESDFVSGNAARGWSTPAGAYPLTYKQRNATLKGEGYATPVSYWMPFNGGIGLHDASWRGSFGGSIYKRNGSHGCINLPKDVAKTIYENISKGDPVLCYHLDGTESEKSSRPAKKTPAATVPAAETQPAAPAESTEAAAAPETEPTGPTGVSGPTGPTAAPEAGAAGPTGPTAAPETQAAGPGAEPEPSQPAGPSVTPEPAAGGTTGPGGAPAAPETQAAGPSGPSGAGPAAPETTAAPEPAAPAGPSGPTGPTAAPEQEIGPGYMPVTPEPAQAAGPAGPG